MRILLTGGGTAGHVLPNIAVIEEVKRLCPECEILYVGLKNGPEKQICENHGIPFKGIFAGKFRRYLSVNNFIDIFKLPIGLIQAAMILKKFRPSAVFSKGGYVSAPVVISAKFLKIPVIVHEADFVSGLANKICARFAEKICVTFPESKGFDANKTVLTGMPVRKFIFEGSKEEAKNLFNIKDDKPVVLVMGGSLGAVSINEAVWNSLPKLLPRFNIIHITGKGKIGLNTIHQKLDNYRQIEYADAELPHLYALSSMIVSRAGASAIAEISALNKPNILIPLGLKASRGEQIENANYMKSIGASEVIYPNENLKEELPKKILEIMRDRKKLEEMAAASAKFGELCGKAGGKIAEMLIYG